MASVARQNRRLSDALRVLIPIAHRPDRISSLLADIIVQIVREATLSGKINEKLIYPIANH